MRLANFSHFFPRIWLKFSLATLFFKLNLKTWLYTQIICFLKNMMLSKLVKIQSVFNSQIFDS